ncbi:MAG: radical SAM protein [Polyangiaceae bacterium]|nr:radical SAM protein [Polyangiaceae bacterium]
MARASQCRGPTGWCPRGRTGRPRPSRSRHCFGSWRLLRHRHARRPPKRKGIATPPVYLRLSVTDRCNLRCRYCRTDVHTATAPGLPDEAMLRIVGAMARLVPIRKVRFTGGEPLVRAGLPALVGKLRRLLPNAELAMTTNGTLLHAAAVALRDQGLDSVNISLDTTDPAHFARLTGGGRLESVLAGVEAARRVGFDRLKLNAVLLRSVHRERRLELVRFAAQCGCELRLLELMPIGAGALIYDGERLGADEALDELRQAFGRPAQLPSSSNSRRYLFDVDGVAVTVGLIAPVSRPFCTGCDRLRVDAHARLYPCLRSAEAWELFPRLLDRHSTLALEVGLRAAMSRKRAMQATDRIWPARSMAATGG